MPETTGKTLEEMGALFGDEVVIHFAADGTGLVEVDADAAFAEKIDHVHQIETVGEHKGHAIESVEV